MGYSVNQNLSGDQFVYQIGLKNKPNAQGTLFRAKPEARNPSKRYPRGFTPERHRAVAEALGVQYKDFRGTGYGQHPHGGRTPNVYRGHAEVLARAVEDIARSTVPMRAITRPDPSQPASRINPDLHLGVWHNEGERRRSEYGHYSAPGTTAIEHQGRIAIMSDSPSHTTPIHEIGHHVDRLSPYITPSQRGSAEGFAERYAETHARTPGYKQRKVEIPSMPHKWFGDPGLQSHAAREDFERSFNYEHPLNTKQFDFMEDTRKTLGPKTFPSHHVPGQQSLLEKTATYNPHRYKDTDPVVTDIRWTYK